jgi:hypothetical protein
MASAIAYPLLKKTDQGDVHAWTEIGSVRVAKAGLGLFDHLISAHAMRAYLLEPPADRFVLDIVDGNTHSRHVFTKAGAVPFVMPDALRDQVMATIAPGDQNKPLSWFQIGVEAMPKFAQHMLEAVDRPKTIGQGTAEEYVFDYSRNPLVTLFRDALEQTAGRDFGDATRPDSSKGMNHYKTRPGPP